MRVKLIFIFFVLFYLKIGGKMYWTLVIPEKKEGIKKLYKCVCGKEVMVYSGNVSRGLSNSCGCFGKEKIPHNVRRTFSLMKFRCSDKAKNQDRIAYYLRGIRVLYKDYYEFYKDVGDKPSKEYTIDRINVNKNYEIGNCRWATIDEQANNRTTNVMLEYQGKTMTISQWARENNLKISTLRERLKRGWTLHQAFTKKVDEVKSIAGKSKK